MSKKCIKTCKCEDCEMLQTNHHLLLEDDTNPFGIGKRLDINGVRCMNYASVAINTNGLKESEIYDDWLYASKYPWVKDFLETFEVIR